MTLCSKDLRKSDSIEKHTSVLLVWDFFCNLSIARKIKNKKVPHLVTFLPFTF